MTTVAVQGIGSILGVGNGASPEVFTKVSQLKSIKFGGFTVEFDEITNLDSVLYKEWMKTLIDAKEISMEGIFKPTDASQQSFVANIQTAGSAALKNYQVLTPDGTKFNFAAYASDFVPGIEYNKAIAFSAKLKITGAVTITWSA